ncbi:ParB N-terminal domain-containing protein [Leptospira sp. P2653]|uniref:ParB N-terminal domain-containing protein n=1 Tax=Leptospira sp. P2653 TaxID=1218600 RepID=UPI0002BF4702|nr:ParB N-terminal domain-containing protein [Leptospira sp. P2653]EMJ63508.1 ParB-like protein [Leptospira sp. P2653]
MNKVGSQDYLVSKMKLAPELQNVQGMMPISADDYNKLYKSIEANGIKDPLRGYLDDDRIFNILSGANRFDIAKKLNYSTAPVEIYIGGTQQEREEFALDENEARRHFTNEQKRALIEYRLRLNPNVTDRSIAKKVGVDNKTVAATRRKLEDSKVISKPTNRTASDGRTYNTNRQQPKVTSKKVNQLKNSPTENEPLLTKTQIKSRIKTLEIEINDLKSEIEIRRKELTKLKKI